MEKHFPCGTANLPSAPGVKLRPYHTWQRDFVSSATWQLIVVLTLPALPLPSLPGTRSIPSDCRPFGKSLAKSVISTASVMLFSKGMGKSAHGAEQLNNWLCTTRMEREEELSGRTTIWPISSPCADPAMPRFTTSLIVGHATSIAASSAEQLSVGTMQKDCAGTVTAF
jgi:hypothetical protein